MTEFDTADRAKDKIVDLLAKEEEKALKEILHEPQEEIELTDSELLKVMAIHADLSQKYYYKKGSLGDYKSLATEYMDRLEEIGLVCQVDYIKKGLAADPDRQPVEVTITARINPIDREQQYDEVRSGIADEYYERKRNRK